MSDTSLFGVVLVAVMTFDADSAPVLKPVRVPVYVPNRAVATAFAADAPVAPLVRFAKAAPSCACVTVVVAVNLSPAIVRLCPAAKPPAPIVIAAVSLAGPLFPFVVFTELVVPLSELKAVYAGLKFSNCRVTPN
jgi:hypothetical protein